MGRFSVNFGWGSIAATMTQKQQNYSVKETTPPKCHFSAADLCDIWTHTCIDVIINLFGKDLPNIPLRVIYPQTDLLSRVLVGVLLSGLWVLTITQSHSLMAKNVPLFGDFLYKEHCTHQNVQGLQVFFSQMGGVNVSVNTEFITDWELNIHSSLNSSFEEVDVSIILHCIDSVSSGLRRLLILSNDTDVLVIATYFLECFKSNGLSFG